MNYLELCQAVAGDVGVNGTQSGTAPTAVAGQTGELRRIVRWVAQAWLDVQGQRHWPWLWQAATLTVAQGDNTVATSLPANRWVKETGYYVPAGGNARFEIDYLPWEDFRAVYDEAWIASGNQITAWTIRPDNAFVVNSLAPVATVIHVERYCNPTKLVLDTDTPGMPEDLHQLVVEKAKVLYANFDEAGVLRSTAQAEVIRLERDLRDRCLPEYRIGGPLA